MKYRVQIEERRHKIVDIDADSAQEARAKCKEQYDKNDIQLDFENVLWANFYVLPKMTS